MHLQRSAFFPLHSLFLSSSHTPALLRLAPSYIDGTAEGFAAIGES
jgi:hypothetical protein